MSPNLREGVEPRTPPRQRRGAPCPGWNGARGSETSGLGSAPRWAPASAPGRRGGAAAGAGGGDAPLLTAGRPRWSPGAVGAAAGPAPLAVGGAAPGGRHCCAGPAAARLPALTFIFARPFPARWRVPPRAQPAARSGQDNGSAWANQRGARLGGGQWARGCAESNVTSAASVRRLRIDPALSHCGAPGCTATQPALGPGGRPRERLWGSGPSEGCVPTLSDTGEYASGAAGPAGRARPPARNRAVSLWWPSCRRRCATAERGQRRLGRPYTKGSGAVPGRPFPVWRAPRPGRGGGGGRLGRAGRREARSEVGRERRAMGTGRAAGGRPPRGARAAPCRAPP